MSNKEHHKNHNHHEHRDPHSVTDKPFTTTIKRINDNTPNIKTFFFDYNPEGSKVDIRAGQFLMIWIPGVDEIPMSIAYIGPDAELGITVQNVGDATNRLHQMKVGDYIGIRGPYGNSYKYNGDYSIIIGGGVGTASVRELIRTSYQNSPQNTTAIIASRTESELLYGDEFKALGTDFQYSYCTDDGSCGYDGFSTNYFDENIDAIIQKAGGADKITVYTCGPEIMMKKIFETCEQKSIKVQASLERMMRCGFGLCGLCVLEPTGLKVCQDGPIFESEILRKTDDFGRFKRTFTGEKIKE